MLKLPSLGWAIVDDTYGKLVLFDHRTPIYWLRRIAIKEAEEHGFTTTGKKRDVRICRVIVRQFSR